jgi:hypothetical protein
VTAADLLATAITLLDRAGVPFMVTGSYASSYHGEPRATLDLDIVIDPDAGSLARLIAGLVAARFYVDADAATSALAERGVFNAIGRDASKIDFIVRKDRPFSKAEFERRIPVDLLGTPGFMATAEDMIIAKLEWAAASDSERQLRDVEGMWAANRERLDQAYVGRWIEALGLTPNWNRVARD